MMTRRLVRALTEAVELYAALELADASLDDLQVGLVIFLAAVEALETPLQGFPRVRLVFDDGRDNQALYSWRRMRKKRTRTAVFHFPGSCHKAARSVLAPFPARHEHPGCTGGHELPLNSLEV